jgi:hypothetical protein
VVGNGGRGRETIRVLTVEEGAGNAVWGMEWEAYSWTMTIPGQYLFR